MSGSQNGVRAMGCSLDGVWGRFRVMGGGPGVNLWVRGLGFGV